MKKIIRACTVSMSVGFVKGMLPDLTKKYEVVLLSSPGPEMDEAREQYGVRTIEVPMERHISPVKDFLSLCRLIRVFLKEKPDMVHSMTPKAGLLCMTAAWLTRVPVRIHTFTGLVWPTSTGLKRRILMLTDAITCWCATHVIPEGEGVKADLMNYGITHKPLRILGYGNVRGIDMQRFKKTTDDSDIFCHADLADHADSLTTDDTNFASKREQCQTRLSIAEREQSQDRDSGINCTNNTDMSHAEKLKTKNQKLKTKNSFEFLFVGRIVRDKGINELVEAFCRLNSEMPETRLVLVGFYEQNLDPVSEETHRRIEENPNIIMAGERTGDDLVRSYAEADCFVFPSYREGFPNTVLEAGAMGLPCIVTDINGSREIITDIFSHADLADHADNLYFDHGSTRIHTDDNLTHADLADHADSLTTDDTDIFSHADLADTADYFKLKTKNQNLKTKKNGIIIPPRDAEALYEAMKLMVTDDGMREAMAKNARQMIESRFEQGFVRQCLYDFYEETL